MTNPHRLARQAPVLSDTLLRSHGRATLSSVARGREIAERDRQRDRHLLTARPAYGRVAGRTYIAWCPAAVSLPVLAGTLFDMTHKYDTAVLIAAVANIAGMAMALLMPRRGWRERG